MKKKKKRAKKAAGVALKNEEDEEEERRRRRQTLFFRFFTESNVVLCLPAKEGEGGEETYTHTQLHTLSHSLRARSSLLFSFLRCNEYSSRHPPSRLSPPPLPLLLLFFLLLCVCVSLSPRVQPIGKRERTQKRRRRRQGKGRGGWARLSVCLLSVCALCWFFVIRN